MTYIVALLVIAVGIFDVRTTQVALDNGGREVNPIMRRLMELAPKHWPAIKIGIHVALAVGIVYADSLLVTIGGAVFSAIIGLVVVNNIYRLVRL